MQELPIVGALRTLSIFGADQASAYREHFHAAAEVLGPDIETRLITSTEQWAAAGKPGIRILTGNAGTGKTAAAEAFCRVASAQLPARDELLEVAPGRWVIKDLSGQPDGPTRAASIAEALDRAHDGLVLVCANEGVLRDAAAALADEAGTLQEVLEEALRNGAATVDAMTVVNLNRQRPSAPRLWEAIVDYLTRSELWDEGCDDCPHQATGCPFRTNAAALRNPDVREGLRTLVRLGTGEAVPTLREVLAILAYAIVGEESCADAKRAARDNGYAACTAEQSYFARVLGHGLEAEALERSPLLAGIRQSGLGDVADLQIDEWLRDTTNAPPRVRELAGQPPAPSSTPLEGTHSPHDRVSTAVGTMTFHSLGETVSTSEDPNRVGAGLDALVDGDGVSRQALWRRRIFFEAPRDLGGFEAACGRLLEARHLPDLARLADDAANGRDTALQLDQLVIGLNFLVRGFNNSTEGLIVPDQSCLFARDPGSFRPAQPSLVQRQIDLSCLSVATPDSGLVLDLLDVDPIEVDLIVNDDGRRHMLRIRPRLHEALRLAALYQGPVGQGIAEMADLRAFYGELASTSSDPTQLRVADPNASPPALIPIRLPHQPSDD